MFPELNFDDQRIIDLADIAMSGEVPRSQPPADTLWRDFNRWDVFLTFPCWVLTGRTSRPPVAPHAADSRLIRLSLHISTDVVSRLVPRSPQPTHHARPDVITNSPFDFLPCRNIMLQCLRNASFF